MEDIALTKVAQDALCVALARSRGTRGYSEEDSGKLSEWAMGIVRQAEELREIVQGTRGLYLADGCVETFPLAIARERSGGRRGLVGECIKGQAIGPVLVTKGADKRKGPTGNPRTLMTLGNGLYKLMAKPGSLYDTVLGICDKACHLAESPDLFEKYRANEITAQDLAISISISMDKLVERIEQSPKYAAYMQRVSVLAAGGSIRAAAKASRSIRERLFEATYLLAQSSAKSTAQPRNAWRLRNAGLVFLKASISKSRDCFYCLFPAKYENDYDRMLSEIGAATRRHWRAKP